MYISKNEARGKHHETYDLYNDKGSGSGSFIARFSSLQSAGLAMRYLSGANMPESDQAAARATLHEYDLSRKEAREAKEAAKKRTRENITQ